MMYSKRAKWLICFSICWLIGCTDKIVDSETIEHTNGTDRLVLRDVESRISGGTAYDFHSLVWERSDGQGWSTVVEIDAQEFRGGSQHLRWVSQIESLDPNTGHAVIKVAEGDAPEGSKSVSYVYSWREWDLLENVEVRVVRIVQDPFEAFSPSASPGNSSVSSSRQVSNPYVPEHPKRSRLLGEWLSEGESVFVVEASEAGRVTIRSPEEPPWESVINNVRWDGDTLRYDQYAYYTGPEKFTSITNPSGDHPFSGVRNNISLNFTDDPDRLKLTGSTVHVTEPIGMELTRSPKGG